jgi:NAD(P) transhydrogenase subunit beta
MTAMPQRIALSLTLSALAAALVGVAEYYTRMAAGTPPDRVTMTALGFEIMLGSITVAGTIVAAGKLQEWITSRPLSYPGQKIVNAVIFLAIVGLFVSVVVHPDKQALFYAMIALSTLFGVTLVLPIGGADMPVVVALLNSYSGLASCATGFAIGNVILIISGSLDGSSGFILSVLMSKAMNRSFTNVLFGAFGSEVAAGGAKSAEGLTVRSIGIEDAAIQLA